MAKTPSRDSPKARAPSSRIEVRDVARGDAPQLAELLNAIIAQGGTTALEEPFTPEGLAEAYLVGPAVLCCVVALDTASTGCALSGGVVSFPAIGTCVLDFSQGGSTTYAPAPPGKSSVAPDHWPMRGNGPSRASALA